MLVEVAGLWESALKICFLGRFHNSLILFSVFQTSSKVIERALRTERSDIFIDYVGASDEMTKGFDADGPETLLKNLDLLSHDRWSKHRVVTSLQWSPHFNGESAWERLWRYHYAPLV